MGCFDYECSCGGKTCIFRGGQDGGESDVIIELPLNDSTTVFVKGKYEMYGAVHVGDYMFYPKQFERYFEGWLSSESEEARSKIFTTERIWTTSYYDYDDDGEYEKRTFKDTDCFPLDISVLVNLDNTIIKKCIRADTRLNIPSDDDKRKARIEKLKSTIEVVQQELSRINCP
jgi:hypothetical protein